MGKVKDPDTGKEYDESEFDDTRSWSKAKDDKGFYGHNDICLANKTQKKSPKKRSYF